MSRRGLLALGATGVAGVGIGLSVLESVAYTSAAADRTSIVKIEGDTDGAFLGLLVADTIKKEKRSLLCEITNNAGRELAITVALDDPTQGTLTGPNGSGGAVDLTLAAGDTASVDLASGEPNGTTVPFTISHADPEVSFEIDRATTVESGNTDGEVAIDKLKRFKSNAGADEWTIKDLEASSTNYDLDSVEVTVAEVDSGTVVATREYTDITGTSFTRSGTGNDPGVTLQPDSASYDVRKNVTYRLTVTATDADGNFARETATK